MNIAGEEKEKKRRKKNEEEEVEMKMGGMEFSTLFLFIYATEKNHSRRSRDCLIGPASGRPRVAPEIDRHSHYAADANIEGVAPVFVRCALSSQLACRNVRSKL